MKRFLILFAFSLILVSTGTASKMSRGFKTMEKGKYEKAIKQFKDEASSDPNCAICYYGLALIYDDPSYKGYNLERAYRYVHKAIDILNRKHPSSVEEEFARLGIRTSKTKRLAGVIEGDLLTKALKDGELKSIQSYINKHKDALNLASAISKRDQLAYKIAQSKNTVESFDEFLTKYPKSVQAPEAIIIRNTLAFERAKGNNTIDAYDHFITNYPEAEEIGTAIELRNQKAYIALLESQELQHEAELKAHKMESEVKDLQIKNQQQVQKYYVITGVVLSLVLLLVVAGYILKRRDNIKIKNQKQRIVDQRDEILSQKTLLEDKNNQILDSIKYAQLIQSAILPPANKIKSNFSDAFVLYLPKDLVSGDFYWYGERDGKKIIAAVDCTGHGVPGAFMSMIGNTLLNTIVQVKGITAPNDILSELRTEVIKSLDVGEREHQDGMDIALCVIDEKAKTAEFSGAFNPLIHINGELSVVKGDRMPIGRYHGKENKPFTKHLEQLKTGDTLYLFSDGYQDQFGGKDNKKFSSKRFRELLMEIHMLPMEDQHKRLQKELSVWRGKTEQVDDVLVLGVRI